MFFNIVKDLFKSTEDVLRSGKVQVCSKGEGIFVLGGLRKKYLTRCRIRAQNTIFTQFNKQCSSINIVKDLFKSIEGLLRSGKVQVCSMGEKIVVLGGLRKKYLTRCQISRSKYYLYTV